jgi:hypothetical protein
MNSEVIIIRNAIGILEEALGRFIVKIDQPLFLPEEGRKRFKYPTPSPIILQVLKGVRIVSGLNALLCLLERGFVQEMGVILRTIDDFDAEIMFVQEAIDQGTMTAHQQEFIDSFFKDEPPTTQDIERGRSGKPRTIKKKIIASLARIFGPFGNPDRVRRIAEGVHETLSGYVHGSYPHIMEMYGGMPGRFHIRGMLGTPRIKDFQDQIAIYVHRSLNTFSQVAMNLQLNDLALSLIETRRGFERSSAYQGPGIRS